jgi:hypothetical protein
VYAPYAMRRYKEMAVRCHEIGFLPLHRLTPLPQRKADPVFQVNRKMGEYKSRSGRGDYAKYLYACRETNPVIQPVASHITIIFFSWGETVHLVLRPLFGRLYKPRMRDNGDYGAIGGMRIGRGNLSQCHFVHHKSHTS